MRSLGDLEWLKDYVGIPYLKGGRDPREGLDCFGLCRLIYAQEYGIQLPDWQTDQIQLKEIDKAIAGQVTSGTFTQVDTPADGDFVVCLRTKLAHHLGLYYGGGVLHTATGKGTIYEPLSRFQRDYVKVIFGDWTP
jgi:probable lipoprotein NlpC